MIEVLVAHKEAMLRELIKDMILARGDYKVMMTDCMGQTLAAVRNCPISLTIMDYELFSPSWVFGKSAKYLRPEMVIALTDAGPEDGGDNVDVRVSMMDLHDRLDEILALANSKSA